MAALRQPGRKSASHHAERGEDDDHREQGRRDRERRIVARAERVERNRHDLAVGECEEKQDKRNDGEDGIFHYADHAGLTRPSDRAPF